MPEEEKLEGEIMRVQPSDHFSSRWSDLHMDVLSVIVNHLNYVEYIRLTAVCSDWRATAISLGSSLLCGAPFLLLPEDDYPKFKITSKYTHSHLFYHSKTSRFFSLCDRKPHKFDCPKLQGRWCAGSSFGWLITVDQQFKIHLFHPLSNAELELPLSLKYVVKRIVLRRKKVVYELDYDRIRPGHPRMVLSVPDMKDTCLFKVILTSNPSLGDDYKVIAIDTGFGTLAYYDMTNSSWVSFGRGESVEDMLYLKGKLYALRFGGDVRIWDLSDASPRMVAETLEPAAEGAMASIYTSYKTSYSLVESEGNIFQAVRMREGWPEMGDHKTCGFDVYKLDECELKWIKVSSIGDKAMFLGKNHSFCVSASDYPCCRGNCIYFTDFFWEYYSECDYGGFDNGIYCLETSTVEPLYDCASSLIWPPPIWLTPSNLEIGFSRTRLTYQ